MTVPAALRIAVFLNGPVSAYTSSVRDSFTTAIHSSSSSPNNSTPPPEIDFFDPIVAQIYPDPARYDLLVLSGGTADPMGDEEWVLKMHAFLRGTAERFPRKKMVGVCWGHQTIAVAFGGRVAAMDKAEIGITTIPLTAAGSTFFPALACSSTPSFKIHEYHKRQIVEPAPGFTALAENNQSFLSEDNRIISFQGHPEMNAELIRTMFKNVPAYMGVSQEEKESIAENIQGEHDGVEIWRRVLEWVREG